MIAPDFDRMAAQQEARNDRSEIDALAKLSYLCRYEAPKEGDYFGQGLERLLNEAALLIEAQRDLLCDWTQAEREERVMLRERTKQLMRRGK